MPRISPCLWFDTEGEEAARFYTSVFPNSRIVDVAHYGSAGPRPEGTVMLVTFELDGQRFLALNGGPEFTSARPSRSRSTVRARTKSITTGTR
jgi:predicted 3-demethylubiquinone-9 3-methyltransferase (glyoxalase superfamily)